MLIKPSLNAADCRQHAAECELEARRASDLHARDFFLDIADRWHYPPLSEGAKRKILGLNSARLYGLPLAATKYGDGDLASYATAPELQPGGSLDTALRGVGYPTPVVPASLIPDDRFAKLRRWAEASGRGRIDTRHGWIRTRV